MTRFPSRLRDTPILAGLLAVFLVLCIMNNAILPAFEAADEGDHFAYAALLADRWVRGDFNPPDLTQDLAQSHEITQPPLYYVLVAAVIAPFDLSNLPDIRHLNPDWFDPDVNADRRSVTNQYRHTSAEAFPWHGAALALHVARLFSTLLGALTVALVYATVRLLAPAGERIIPLLAAALVALNPKFVHIASIVSNDSAIISVAILACWWMVSLWMSPRRPGWPAFLLLGVLIGLATLCKVSGLGLFVPAGVLLLMLAARTPARPVPSTLFAVLCLVAGFSITAGPWFAYNFVHYGDPLAWAQVQAANQSLLRPVPLSLTQMVGAVPEVLVSYWSVIGIELRFPAWVNAVFVVAAALAVIGVVLRARQLAERTRLAGAYMILLAWEFALLVSYAAWLRDYTGTENSRLIFPGINLVAALVATGWLALVPNRECWRSMVALGACALLGLLSAATPFWLIQPAFATPAYLTAQERAALPGQSGASFAGQISLQHAQVEQRDVEPGRPVRVTLYWGALQRLNQSYHTVLVARDDRGELIGRLEAIPFGGRFDTQRWPVGEIFRDEYLLPIDPGAKRGVATVELSVRGVYANPPLLPVDGAHTSNFIIGPVKVLGPLQPVAAPQSRLEAIFANGTGPIILLEGYDLRSQVGGETPALSFHWRCLKSPDQDYTLFVHVLDRDGTIIAQDDAPPRNGAYPTSLWDAGEQIVDLRSIQLPANAVSLRLGWYPSKDPHAARLAAQKAGGAAWPDNAVVISLATAGAP